MPKPRRQKLRIVQRARDAAGKQFLGSDARLQGGIYRRCKLCLGSRQIRLSHITPRWMYKFARKEGVLVGAYPSLGLIAAEQDGSKHYLLCDECEQHLGDAENYLCSVVSRNTADWSRLGLSVENGGIIGLNIGHVERALIGILFKSHFANSPPFQRIRLQPRFLREVRRHLLGRTSLPLRATAIMFVSKMKPGIDPRAMMIPSWEPEHDPPFFSIMAGGWEWYLFIDVAGSFVHSPFYGDEFRSDSPFRPVVGDITQHRFIAAARQFKKDLDSD